MTVKESILRLLICTTAFGMGVDCVGACSLALQRFLNFCTPFCNTPSEPEGAEIQTGNPPLGTMAAAIVPMLARLDVAGGLTV